jgi:SPP1 gp7 family putative phage head morphogenesis protein
MSVDLVDYLKEISNTKEDLISNLNQKIKAYSELEIQLLMQQLTNLGISPAQIKGLFQIFEKYDSKFKEVFEKFYPEIWQNGYDEAYNYIERFAKLQNPTAFLAIPKVYILDVNSIFYQQFVAKGQQRITAALTKQFYPQTMQIISNGLTANRNWKQIIADVKNSVGIGAKWHWSRLVRTEMQIAYGETFNERYANAGIKYVKLVVASTACPICVGAQGLYVFTLTRPEIPLHPNCRCTYVPFFSLPKNAIPINAPAGFQDLGEIL